MTPSTSDHHLDAAATRQPNGMCRAGFERQHSLPSSEYLGADGGLYQVHGESSLGNGSGGGALKALSGGSKHPPRSVMPPGALVLPLLSSGRTLDGSLCPQIPLLFSQIPPQPRRAAPTTPPPPVKRRDRDALVVSGSGEKAGMGSWGHPVLRMVARPMSENWGLQAWG